MKNKILFLLLIIFFNLDLHSQQNARVIEDLVYKSDKLNLEIKYSIYLPPDYYLNKKSYPVLFLLHGGGGDNNAWLHRAKVDQVTDKLINNNEISPLIIVMPTMGPFSFYLNWLNGPKWEDGFVEFVDYIDKNYRTIKNYDALINKIPAKGIAGLSMGGYGALSLGFKHPDLFNSVISLSGALLPGIIKQGETPFSSFPMNDNQKAQMEMLLGGIFGRPFNADYWNKNNPFNLIDNIKNKKLRVYLTCGDHDDFKLFLGSAAMQQLLLSNEIDSKLEISSGKHSWDFWNEYLEKLLKFFDESF